MIVILLESIKMLAYKRLQFIVDILIINVKLLQKLISKKFKIVNLI